MDAYGRAGPHEELLPIVADSGNDEALVSLSDSRDVTPLAMARARPPAPRDTVRLLGHRALARSGAPRWRPKQILILHPFLKLPKSTAPAAASFGPPRDQRRPLGGARAGRSLNFSIPSRAPHLSLAGKPVYPPRL